MNILICLLLLLLLQNLQEITIKRTRVPNFTIEEKSVLAKLVNKRKDVIESKATDTKSIIKKKEAWLLIEKEFNRVIHVYKVPKVVYILFSYINR